MGLRPLFESTRDMFLNLGIQIFVVYLKIDAKSGVIDGYRS